MQAIILAGGKGTRLAERLNGLPKPLVDVCGKPLLDRQLTALAACGIDEAIVLVNHKADQIELFLEGRAGPVRITLVDDGDPRGTAGAVLACMDRLRETFVVVYGDTLFDIDIRAMMAWHRQKAADATLLLHPNDHPADSDLVELDGDGLVSAFHAYPHPVAPEHRNLVNAAFYIVERKAIELWQGMTPPSDFARDLFPAMLTAGRRLGGYVSHEYIKDLGTPKRLDKVERHLASGRVQRARRSVPRALVFLDRDGTLNLPAGHIAKPADLDLLPQAAKAVAGFNEAEFRTVLVTNQPVIARGECSVADLGCIHARLERLLGQEGAFLDGVEYCPHHPDAGFPGEVASLKIACDCRKPATAMLERALTAFNADRSRCWMIGDTSADMLAANRAGLLSVLVETGDGGRDGVHPGVPDFVVSDVGAAARLIIDVYPRLEHRVASIVAGIEPGSAVLLGGLARTGKSSLAAALRNGLQRRGIPAITVSLDRWLRSESDRSPGVRGRYDLERAQDALAPWFDGGEWRAALPFYDRFTRTSRQGDGAMLPADGVMIVEGVPALAIDTGGRRVDRIVAIADETARARRMCSDMIARGASQEAASAAYAERSADETPLVARWAERADHYLTLDDLLEVSD